MGRAADRSRPGAAAATASSPFPDELELVEQVDAYLSRSLGERRLPGNLREAIRYALLAPGKRMRPILVLRSCEAVGGRLAAALPAAAAVEMVHAFSLVHDDLPAMDDDDLRRGRPTLHKHTSEAMAVLAGDALLGLAVELVATRLEPPALANAVGRELIVGANDMIAGQVYDTLPDAGAPADPLERLRTIHRHKTGALIRAACRMGGLCGGADERPLEGLTRFAEAIGLMFQAVDDLLDVTQTTEHLGKTAGKDADQSKLTYPSVLGLPGTRREIERLRAEALAALREVGERSAPLGRLCEYLAVRTR
jgi:geranylgeranyl diphosphate synthase type II